MAHLYANFRRDPSKIGEKIMFRTSEEYIYDLGKITPHLETTKNYHINILLQ